MLYFLQQCLNAVQVSCFYALLAAAYVLVHGIADRINLSFGGIATWGGARFSAKNLVSFCSGESGGMR